MTFIPTVKKENLVAFYPFSEGSGSTVYDYSGEGNDGTNSGVDYIKVSDGGYGADYGGGSDATSLPTAVKWDVTKSFTVAFWMNPDSTGTNRNICGTHVANPVANFGMAYRDTDDLQLTIASSGTYNISTNIGVTVPMSKWTFVVVVGTIDGSNNLTSVDVYVDNVLYEPAMNTTNPIQWNDGYVFKIGDNAQGSWTGFDGKIKNFCIFETGFTAEEVKTLYKQTYIQ